MIRTPTGAKQCCHPTGLYILSIAEAGERLGFYLLLALFTLYLNERLGLSEAAASTWYGNYTALAYVAALPGGWVAGRCGQRRQWIVVGALLLGAGYLLMGQGLRWLPWSVGVLVVGNGFFKPNISALVGQLYRPDDANREEGYSVFYTAINLGGLIAPLAGELARSAFGWPATFCLAGGVLGLSVIALLLGWRHIPAARTSSPEKPAHSDEENRGSTAHAERRQLIRAVTVLLVMTAAIVPFWAAVMQSGNALTFWARDNTTRALQLLGWRFVIPPGVYAAVNPALVALLALPVSRSFAWLAGRGKPVTPGWKMILGLLLTAAGCGVMVAAGRLGGDTGRVSQAWLIGCYLLHSCGEL